MGHHPVQTNAFVGERGCLEKNVPRAKGFTVVKRSGHYEGKGESKSHLGRGYWK